MKTITKVLGDKNMMGFYWLQLGYIWIILSIIIDYRNSIKVIENH